MKHNESEPNEEAEASDKVRLYLELGRMLFNFGASTRRITDSIRHLARCLGCSVHLVLNYDALLITVKDGDTEYTRIDSSKRSAGLNLLGLARVSALLRGLPEIGANAAEVEGRMHEIARMPPVQSVPLQALAAGCVGAAFCIVNGGDPVSWVCSGIASAFIFGIRRPLAARSFNHLGIMCAISLAGSLLSLLLARFAYSNTLAVALAAPLLFLVPGLPLINGGIDIVRNHLAMGVSRLCFTLAVLVALNVGVAPWIALLPSTISPPHPMTDVAKVLVFAIAGALASGGIAAINNGSLPVISLCALGGLTGRFVRQVAVIRGLDPITASLIGVVCGTLVVSSIANRLRWPAVVISVIAALPMVPGYYAIAGLHSLLSFAAASGTDSAQLDTGLQMVLRATFICGALVAGIIGPVVVLEHDTERV